MPIQPPLVLTIGAQFEHSAELADVGVFVVLLINSPPPVVVMVELVKFIPQPDGARATIAAPL